MAWIPCSPDRADKRRAVGLRHLLRLAPWALGVALSAAVGAGATSNSAADLVVRGARIWTGEAIAAGMQEPTALAVRGERLVAIGAESEIAPLVGPATRVVDAGGRRLLPGFIDSHTHFLGGGESLLGADLRLAASREEFVRRFAEYARGIPAGRWITNVTWDHERWPGAPLPTRDWIDAASGDHPVFISRLDGHMALANSRALALAGITRATPDPNGGTIVRDPATGEPTGILKEDAAMGLVFAVQPKPSSAELADFLAAAMAEAGRRGVTSVVDFGSWPAWPLLAEWPVYRAAKEAGKLTVRISLRSPISQWEAQRDLAASDPKVGRGDEWVSLGGFKGYADGSLGSSTAIFFEPYADAPETSGIFSSDMFPEGEMERRIAAADRLGFQSAVHAIGERGNATILDIYERVAAANGPRDRRPRIEHAQHLRPADIPRFARLGVVASMQPFHAADDGRWAEKRLGRERSRDSYVFRSLLDSGAHLAFGTDWPIAPLDPMLGIAAAVTRRTLDGKNPGGWHPEQKITLSEALGAYTSGSAYAQFAEGDKGTLAPGKLADFILMSEDPFAVPPERLDSIHPTLTVVGGRIVFESAASAASPAPK
jgi:predicted amidohydrolase YtcJ